MNREPIGTGRLPAEQRPIDFRKLKVTEAER